MATASAAFEALAAVLTLALAPVLALVLGRAFLVARIARLVRLAVAGTAILTLEPAPAPTAAMAAALAAKLAVTTLVVTVAGPDLGGGGLAAKQALEPGEETAGLLRRRGRSRALAATEIARRGAALSARGIAARFARLERTGLTRFERARLARFLRTAVAAFRKERRTLVAAAAGLAILGVGAFAPADGGALHFLSGKDVELGLGRGSGRGGLRRAVAQGERKQLALG